MKIEFPYGKEKLTYAFDENRLAAVLTSKMGEYRPDCSQEDLVENAIEVLYNKKKAEKENAYASNQRKANRRYRCPAVHRGKLPPG